eukprot:CAMPEP_0201727490 /NCGR_PEP_ID=MMETSP0593-20130828/12513_1 /ASSEMBLY_ACC=CAM_ASM_000672 /TAXON_ID=267983 /ORGANISM="Skeletonema japonicum, Strain CCMP2506" /LENGTH=46 /DNA_ID= /DNA_START= /DNA_END= /DNA_ORIENTATION=
MFKGKGNEQQAVDVEQGPEPEPGAIVTDDGEQASAAAENPTILVVG